MNLFRAHQARKPIFTVLFCMSSQVGWTEESCRFCFPSHELSSGPVEPYREVGEIIDEGHPRFHPSLERALRDYPDLIYCLHPEERVTASPDLLAYDWHRTDGNTAHQVCLFRILSFLGTPEVAAEYLEISGFEVRGPITWEAGLAGKTHTAVVATLTGPEARSRTSLQDHPAIRFFLWLADTGVYIQASYDEAGALRSVSISAYAQ